jgi:histidine ammonia-lyase
VTGIAIELLCACQALDFARRWGRSTPLKAGKGTEAAYRAIRARVPFLRRDRVLHGDIQTILDLIRSGTVLGAVERTIGSLS